jgi:3-phenylpropionate/trans-cinnamate dioxygenase ferredoxin subunit
MFNYTTLDPMQVEYIEIAPLEQLPDGERIFIEVEGRSIVIFNLAGTLFAIGDVCSHDSGPVGDGDIEKFEIICPRHGARFCLRTGRALTPPAYEPVRSYPTRVVDGIVEVESVS